MSQITQSNNSGTRKKPKEPGLLATRLGIDLSYPLPSYKHSAAGQQTQRAEGTSLQTKLADSQNQYAFQLQFWPLES